MTVRNKQAAPGKKPAPKKTPAKAATKRKTTTRRPKRKSTRSKKGKVGLGKRLFSIGWSWRWLAWLRWGRFFTI